MKVTRVFNYEEIRKLIESTSEETSVYVGSDSQIKGGITDFVTAIVIHFDSKHGCKIYYNRSKETRRMALRDRLWQEVYMSTEAAFNIVDSIGMRYFEVHLDLNSNPNHKSNVIVKEALSYVRASGFEPKIKDVKDPGCSFAATYAANHFVKK